MRLLVCELVSSIIPSGGLKKAIRRRSIMSIDFSSINFVTLEGTLEPTDPAPEQTWILVAVSGSK